MSMVLPLRPGDEIIWDNQPFVVIDPSYMGDGPLLEHCETAEERLIDLDTWTDALDNGAIQRLDDAEGNDPEDIPNQRYDSNGEADAGFASSNSVSSSEVAISCPSCGEISHCQTASMAANETMIMDCSVCCRPMVVVWDGFNAHVSEP